MRKLNLWIQGLVALIWLQMYIPVAVAYDIPERRRDQTQTTPGYILTPAAANIPGIGFTYGFLASYFNVAETETDLLGFRFWGDLAGTGLGVIDMMVLPEFADIFSFTAFYQDLEKVGIESYRRGPKSKKDDHNLIEINEFVLGLVQFNLRLFDKRWQINASVNQQQSRLGSIRDKEGELIAEGDGSRIRGVNRAYGTLVDLTDDRSDPRDGLQAEVYRYDRPDPGGDDPHFYVMDYNVLYFVPIGAFSTWGFNLYRSDAVVMRPGQTDQAKIKEELGFGCDNLPIGSQKTACEDTQNDFASETESANRHGTASPLGGTQRLRSYTTNRWSGAHSLFTGTEFRWNLTEEFTPFNIFIAGGVRTGIQIAFFAEGGTVADLPGDLDKYWKYSYGTGVRAILASGFVVRLDLATGSEGVQPSLIFEYPWKVF